MDIGMDYITRLQTRLVEALRGPPSLLPPGKLSTFANVGRWLTRIEGLHEVVERDVVAELRRRIMSEPGNKDVPCHRILEWCGIIPRSDYLLSLEAEGHGIHRLSCYTYFVGGICIAASGLQYCVSPFEDHLSGGYLCQ
jgi:hypothetical protein